MGAGKTSETGRDGRGGAALGAARGLVRDERGGELMEWALVAGLLVIATIALVGAVGNQVMARWGTANPTL